MNKQLDSTTLFVPICLVESDMTALLHIEAMQQQQIPVMYDAHKQLLVTDSEANAEKARYVMFAKAQ